MIGELIESVVMPVLRFLGHIFFEIFVEFSIQGPGYLICRLFSKKVQPDDMIVYIVGFIFWIVVLAVIYTVYTISNSQP